MGIMKNIEQGDIGYINLSPTKGHEQSGLRPAIVVSNNLFNKITKMVCLCPISSNTKQFPTHYELTNTNKIKGSVLCEHIRSVDLSNRCFSFVEKVDALELVEILDLVASITEINND